jgi:hypothetical protein
MFSETENMPVFLSLFLTVSMLSCRTGALSGRRSLRDVCTRSVGPPDGRDRYLRVSVGEGDVDGVALDDAMA